MDKHDPRIRALLGLGGRGVASAPGEVRFERLLPGPVERLWSWLTESGKRAQWLAAGDMPGEVGQAFVLRFDNAALSAERGPVASRHQDYDREIVSRHTLTRCEPPHVLAFTWGEGGDEPPSEVTFELSQEGDRVRLVLTHRRLAEPGDRRDVTGGWHAHLLVLAERLAGREPPAFWPLVEAVEDDYTASRAWD